MRVAHSGRALNAPTVVHIGPVLYWHSFVIPYNCALILASTITVKHRRFIHPSIHPRASGGGGITQFGVRDFDPPILFCAIVCGGGVGGFWRIPAETQYTPAP